MLCVELKIRNSMLEISVTRTDVVSRSVIHLNVVGHVKTDIDCRICRLVRDMPMQSCRRTENTRGRQSGHDWQWDVKLQLNILRGILFLDNLPAFKIGVGYLGITYVFHPISRSEGKQRASF